ncbi:MAG: hypothetical protein ACE5DI_02970 [Candidatus Micrarchaeia archaeon]
MVKRILMGLSESEKAAYSVVALLFFLLLYFDVSTSGSLKAYMIVFFLLLFLSGLSILSRLNLLESHLHKK